MPKVMVHPAKFLWSNNGPLLVTISSGMPSVLCSSCKILKMVLKEELCTGYICRGISKINWQSEGNSTQNGPWF